MPDWSVKIIRAANPTPNTPGAFVPDLVGAKPGTPLAAQVDDLVTWNNTTGDDHWPWPADSNGQPLPDSQVSIAKGNYFCDRIPAGSSSRPSYDVQMPPSGTTITYCCKLHQNEIGLISVSKIPPLGPTS
jgi:hypothetical protein